MIGPLDLISVFEEPLRKFRFQCRACRANGQWRRNFDSASDDGIVHRRKHAKKTSQNHECDVYNTEGTNHGPCR